MENKSYQFSIQGRITLDLIRKASGEEKLLSKDKLRQIAQEKLPYLNTTDLTKAQKIVAGTAKSAGIKIIE